MQTLGRNPHIVPDHAPDRAHKRDALRMAPISKVQDRGNATSTIRWTRPGLHANTNARPDRMTASSIW
jgi:hypothetical protein